MVFDAILSNIDDYSCGYWDSLCDHLRDVAWEDIVKFSASAVASEFCEWFRPELMYIFLITNIRSDLTHFHDLQLPVLLP